MDDKTLVTTAPPPPSEVRIRTMRSDLESMRKSGGGAPRFQNVAISGLSTNKPQSQDVSPAPQQASAQESAVQPITDPVTAATPLARNSNEHLVAILIVGLVGIIALAAVGYFAYLTFVK